jgi:hypothetical protein
VLRRETPHDFDGFTSSHVVRLRPDLPTDSVYRVTLHECGHVLGLLHTCVSRDPDVSPAYPGAPPCAAESVGVMDPDHAATEFTPADLAELARVQ